MKKTLMALLALTLVFVMVFAVACTTDSGNTDNGNNSGDGTTPPTPPDGGNGNPPTPPDGNGGNNGGGTATVPSPVTDGAESTVAAGTIDLSAASADTDASSATAIAASDENVKIKSDGSYILSGNYTAGVSIAKNLTVHLFLNGATISATDAIALETGKKCTVTITVMDGTTNIITTSGDTEVNALHVKGSLTINGSGSLSVTSANKNAVKVSKALQIVDAKVSANGGNHAIACGSLAAKNAKISVVAVKDGVNADCDFDNSDGTTDYTFVTDEGFVSLVNVDFTAQTQGDGIQAETFVYLLGGSVNITTSGTFVPYTNDNMTAYDLEADDFRYVQNGNTYQKVADDYRGNGVKYALTASCKGIKVGVIEYEVETETTASDGTTSTTTKEYTVDSGDYALVIDGTTIMINSTDDALHVNNGNMFVLSGNLTIATLDDGLTADGLVRIVDGTITVTTSYEGIEGAYVEINGGTINVTSGDDGINAASDDTSIVEYIIIAGGTVTVNADGDGLDSNGTILISGGTVTVHGPTNGGDSGLDADSGILVNGGTVFVASAIGMVETPASNSAQYVISYAQSANIAEGTTIKLVDASGSTVVEVTTVKVCQSVIISSAALQNGASYTLYAGTSQLAQVTISSTITSAGTSQGGPGGGGQGGQPGGPGGWGGR